MDTCLRQFRNGTTVGSWVRRYFQQLPSCAAQGLPKWLDAFLNAAYGKMWKVSQMQYHFELCRHREKCKDCARLSQSAAQDLWRGLESEVLQSLLKIEDLVTFDDTSLPTLPTLAEPGKSFTASKADVILRSSDLVDFRVHQSVLSMASPVFQDMFHLPQSPTVPDDTSSRRELPVIAMEEDSETLGSFVTAIYPIPFYAPNTVDRTMAFLAALQKYGMGLEGDGTLEALRRQYCQQLLPRFMDENACRAYALAVRFRLKEEATLAAQALLTTTLTFKSCGDNLRLLPSGAALHDHSRYRARCCSAAKAALLAGLASQEGSAWFQSHSRSIRGFTDGRRANRYPSNGPDPIQVQVEACAQKRRVKGRGPEMPGWLASHFESMYDRLGAGGGIPLSTNMRIAISA
ncbi:hypothetical protein FA95DRAFT_1553218, partial [Auriscalpium vulgare]